MKKLIIAGVVAVAMAVAPFQSQAQIQTNPPPNEPNVTVCESIIFLSVMTIGLMIVCKVAERPNPNPEICACPARLVLLASPEITGEAGWTRIATNDIPAICHTNYTAVFDLEMDGAPTRFFRCVIEPLPSHERNLVFDPVTKVTAAQLALSDAPMTMTASTVAVAAAEPTAAEQAFAAEMDYLMAMAEADLKDAQKHHKR